MTRNDPQSQLADLYAQYRLQTILAEPDTKHLKYLRQEIRKLEKEVLGPDKQMYPFCLD